MGKLRTLMIAMIFTMTIIACGNDQPGQERVTVINNYIDQDDDQDDRDEEYENELIDELGDITEVFIGKSKADKLKKRGKLYTAKKKAVKRKVKKVRKKVIVVKKKVKKVKKSSSSKKKR